MPITVIKGPEGIRTLFTASGPITQLRSLQILSGASKIIEEATSGQQDRGCGVAAETVVSGDLIRVLTQGLASGVICGSGINAGQAVQTMATSGVISGTGHIAPLLSGVGAMLGKSVMSGGTGSGIQILVDLG